MPRRRIQQQSKRKRNHGRPPRIPDITREDVLASDTAPLDQEFVPTASVDQRKRRKGRAGRRARINRRQQLEREEPERGQSGPPVRPWIDLGVMDPGMDPLRRRLS